LGTTIQSICQLTVPPVACHLYRRENLFAAECVGQAHVAVLGKFKELKFYSILKPSFYADNIQLSFDQYEAHPTIAIVKSASLMFGSG